MMMASPEAVAELPSARAMLTVYQRGTRGPGMSSPMATLPVTIFKFAMSPYENWQKLAWAGVFLITLAVLALNILARVLTRQKH